MNQTENECSTMGKSDLNSSDHYSDGYSCDSKSIVPIKSNFGRHCHIVKRPDFDGYGFNLHSEKVKPGQYIGKVDANSPAEAAGLREGDQIIEVNGVNIGTETHKQVVQRIKAISNEVRLLLIDLNAETVNLGDKNPENNTVSDNRFGTSNSKYPTHEHSSQRIIPVMEVGASEEIDAPIGFKMDNVTSIANQSQSNFNKNTRVQITDLESANGHPTSSIGQATNSLMLSSGNQKATELHQNIHNNVLTTSKTGLNLNLTAAEMRAKLLAKKKFDPKNESVDLKKKFDIIQKL